MAIALIFNITFKEEYKRFIVVVILIMSSCFSISFYERANIEGALTDMSVDYYENQDNTFFIGAGEWLSVKTIFEKELFINSKVITNNGESIPFIKEGTKITFKYQENDEYEYCDVPLLYYKGYTAMLKKSKIKLEVSGEGTNGTIRIFISQNKHGEIIIDYTGTFIQKITYLISISTYMVIGIISLKKIKNYKLLKCK